MLNHTEKRNPMCTKSGEYTELCESKLQSMRRGVFIDTLSLMVVSKDNREYSKWYSQKVGACIFCDELKMYPDQLLIITEVQKRVEKWGYSQQITSCVLCDKAIEIKDYKSNGICSLPQDEL